MKLNPDEISSILKSQISGFEDTADVEEIGTVIQVGDGIARVYGLERCIALEMLELPHGVTGLDRKSTRLNSSHSQQSRMPSSA